MSKKIVSVFLTLLMIMASLVNVGAYYKPGERSHQMTFEECVYTENSTVSSRGEVKLDGFGSVTYDCLITFPISSVNFSYETEEDTQFIITADGVSYEGVLPASDTSFSYKLSSIVFEGEHIIKFTFGNAIKVKSIEMVHYNWTYPDNLILPANSEKTTINLTTAEELVHSAVIIDERSSAIMVNGATRYIDNDNIALKPKNIGGSLYLPIHTLARALGYYYEDKPELDFTLMRFAESEFVLKNGVMTKENTAGIGNVNLPIYRDGDGTWAGIRFFAEAIGDTVVYDNGTVYIDYKHQIKKIRESAAAKNYVAETLGAFEETQTAGNTYYVAQTANANDKNPGTEAAPFRTLNKAGKVAKAGDTVIIREGTYREEFTPQNDGTALNPIVFRAAEGEEVIISATEVLDDFLPYGDDGWVAAHLPKDLGFGNNQIFYKGEGVIEARYPNGLRFNMGEDNEPLSDYFPSRGDFLVDDVDTTLITSPGGLLEQEEKDYWKGALYLSGHGQTYTTCSAIVESSEKGSLRVGNLPSRWWWRPSFQDFYDWGYLQGIKPCMDLPGEWIVEGDTLIMIPPEGETAQGLVVEAKTRQLVANLNNRKFIHLKGIKTIGGSVTMDNTEMCMLDDMDMNYISHFAQMADFRDGFIEENANTSNGYGSPNRGEVGIWLEGKNNIIKDSTFDHSAGAALYISGLYAYVEGNLIDSCGYGGSFVSGIYVYPNLTKSVNEPRGGFALYENDISRANRSCLTILAPENRSGWSRMAYLPYEVAYNSFHDAMLYTLDVGLTYVYACRTCTDRVYSQFHHNYAYHDIDEPLTDITVYYHDGGSEGVHTFNNIAFTTDEKVRYIQETVTEHERGNANWIGMNTHVEIPVPGGPEALEAEWFPNGKPFYAGVPSGKETFMKNYAYDGDFLRLDAKDAKLSGGATLDNEGRIRFNSEKALATFENVDFGEEGINRLVAYYTGSRFARWSRICVKIGDTYETAEQFMNLARSEEYSDKALASTSIRLGERKGVTNVYVEMYQHDDESFALDNIIFDTAGYDYGIRDGSIIYAAEYDNFVRVGQSDMHTRLSLGNGHVEHGTLAYLWESKMKYRNIKIPENSNYIAVYAGVKEPYDSMELIFTYIKDGVEKRIGSTRTLNIAWTEDNIPTYVEIPADVAADISGQIVDICIEAGTTLEGQPSTADFYRVCFMEEKIEPEVTDGSLVYGGNFSDLVEIGDEKLPPRRRLTNGRDKTPFANNVWSGSTVLYENMAVDKSAKRLYCTTGAEEAYAGQKITFRYAKKNETETKVLGTFITTGNGLETDTEMQYIDLPAGFEAGEIDIYVDFGSTETGKKATCNFFKFGFTK